MSHHPNAVRYPLYRPHYGSLVAVLVLVVFFAAWVIVK